MTEIDAISWEIGRITTHCHLIGKGVRAAAEETVHKSAIEHVLKEIEYSGLEYDLKWCGENHVDIVIYKHKHIGEALRLFDECQNQLPEYLRHYVSGKIFGYSEEKIGRYLEGIGQ